MKKIVYAGSFDPLTKGHWWVIQEALYLADEVIVFIAHNPEKKSGMFTPQERKQMIEEVAKANNVEHRINVILVQNEYVAVKAKKMEADYMIRGIRNSNDFDQEATLQRANSEVLLGAKTLFVMPPRELDGVSSSFVKAMVGPIGWHWQIKKFLPEAVYKFWIKKYVRDTVAKIVVNKDYYSNLDGFVETVIEDYQKSGRSYHNLDHLVHCLQELQNLRFNETAIEHGLNFETLCLGILAHDMVYDKAGEDEKKSAIKMQKLLGKNNWTDRVYDIVMATDHLNSKGKKFTLEEKVMRSIDLAVLAQPEFIYNEYVNNVREEYKNYNDEEYQQGRLKILQMFLNLPQIYESEFFSHYEGDAKFNIKNEINNFIPYKNNVI